MRGLLLEGALDLFSYSPQVRGRVLPTLHDGPAGMPEHEPQRGIVLGDIAGERSDDAHGLRVGALGPLAIGALLTQRDDGWQRRRAGSVMDGCGRLVVARSFRAGMVILRCG